MYFIHLGSLTGHYDVFLLLFRKSHGDGMAWSVHHKGPVWEESCGAGTQWFSSDEQSQHCSADTSSGKR